MLARADSSIELSLAVAGTPIAIDTRRTVRTLRERVAGGSSAVQRDAT